MIDIFYLDQMKAIGPRMHPTRPPQNGPQYRNKPLSIPRKREICRNTFSPYQEPPFNIPPPVEYPRTDQSDLQPLKSPIEDAPEQLNVYAENAAMCHREAEFYKKLTKIMCSEKRKTVEDKKIVKFSELRDLITLMTGCSDIRVDPYEVECYCLGGSKLITIGKIFCIDEYGGRANFEHMFNDCYEALSSYVSTETILGD